MNINDLDSIITTLTSKITELAIVADNEEYIALERNSKFRSYTWERLDEVIESLSSIVNALKNVRKAAVNPKTEEDILFRDKNPHGEVDWGSDIGLEIID